MCFLCMGTNDMVGSGSHIDSDRYIKQVQLGARLTKAVGALPQFQLLHNRLVDCTGELSQWVQLGPSSIPGLLGVFAKYEIPKGYQIFTTAGKRMMRRHGVATLLVPKFGGAAGGGMC